MKPLTEDDRLRYWQNRARQAEEQLRKEQNKNSTILRWINRNFGPEFYTFQQTFIGK